ncbi:MAG: hypothetical protein Q4F61_03025, partial [Candidatus Saccharibacteria bacterium]|nr:hypothetical protein [Candidatus Saccharibacteria bacterium]
FYARCCGAEESTGEYILFIDSNDYIEVDFVRQLMFDATKNHSDLVIGNVCNKRKDGYFAITNFSKSFLLGSTSEGDIFDKFIKSEGRFYRWHVIWGKLISRKIWKKASPYFQRVDHHLGIYEDVFFSTLLLRLANKIYLDDDAFYFYDNPNAGDVDQKNLTSQEITKNIDDIIYSFKLTEQSLRDMTGNSDYKENLINWRNTYLEIWLKAASGISEEFFSQTKSEIKKKCKKYQPANLELFYASTAHLSMFNDNLLKIKESIIKHDIISFDIFDTLILRPFYCPTDLFLLMNKDAKTLLRSNGINRFSKIREIAECECREDAFQRGEEEITIDEIYQCLVNHFAIPQDVANKLKSLEIKLERKFCTRRNFGHYLYELAQFLEKKIVITSDMYLPQEDIEFILNHNGYEDYAAFYLSNERRMTKSSGKLFKLVQKENPNQSILHVDDNTQVCEKAREIGLESFQLTKATEALEQHTGGGIEHNFYGISHDRHSFMWTTGVRNSLSLVANKLFDNPFSPYDLNSDFDGSPYNLGYFALGMHLLALSNWLLIDTKEKGLDSLGFMARDGYMPLQITQILQKHTSLNKHIKLNYVHLSRRTTLPLAIDGDYDFGAIRTYIDWYVLSPAAALKELHSFITLPKNHKQRIEDAGFRFNKKFKTEREFLEFLDFVRKNFYDSKKHQDFIEMSKEYLGKYYTGKSGAFDVGYSAKPELLISELVGLSDTYFIHIHKSEAKENAMLSNTRLNTFFQYTPTFTGCLREAFLSDLSPSCISYTRDKNNDVVPVFSDKVDFDTYSQEVITVIQQGALDFINYYIELFKEYFEIFDYDLYNMSIPLEFYLHYSKKSDRQMFNTMQFEANSNLILDINDFWNEVIDDYDYNYVKTRNEHLVDPTTVIPNRRASRMLYYLLFNHAMLKQKFNNKTREKQYHPKLYWRVFYHLLYNKKAIPEKIKQKLTKKSPPK